MNHILHGTKGGGWHHRPGGVNQSNGYKILNVIGKKPSSGSEPYRLLVQAPGRVPKASTFWPNSWSSKKIETVINEVYIREVAMKGIKSRNPIVKSGYGFDIELRLIKDGKGGLKVTTAFPNLKRE